MANDLWRTPPEVFNTLNREFGFVADMASSPKKSPDQNGQGSSK
ncbi:hypothetical protein NVP1211B_20 [Vibrio phage 1.211.B._10N.222.52.F11]|nr:hypothetical protein NVP1211A_20 [Vibrio phage 1.211.A._10N.222.52.F11]AUR95756.1 hypothetical protein NVP1211B_20 [Vibrio phage 1.211.B._10N.222.52.F11]